MPAFAKRNHLERMPALMPRSNALAVLVACSAAAVLAAQPLVVVDVKVASDRDAREVPVVVPIDPSGKVASAGDLVVAGAQPGFVQRDDLDGDGRVDELVFLVDVPAGQSVRCELVPGTPPRIAPRAHAGMYLRGLVGPAWESDVAAYRIYWNNDTALDIFGKTSPILSLKAYATGEFNYHVETKYGLDVLKVNQSLGVGGFGVWLDGRIWKISDTLKTHFVRADGPLRAVLEVQFIDWYTGPGGKKPGESGPGIQRRFDLYGWLSIVAGQHWGQVDLRIHPVDKGPIPEIVTAVVRHEDTELIRDENAGLVARWGRQALGDHEVPKSGDLGLAVLVDPKTVSAYGEDEDDSYVRLTPRDGRVRYWYHGSWFKEPGGARSTAQYEAMLREVIARRPQVKVEFPQGR